MQSHGGPASRLGVDRLPLINRLHEIFLSQVRSINRFCIPTKFDVFSRQEGKGIEERRWERGGGNAPGGR